ncbi:flagellar hook capping FlgD N-terminal domain-containing protein [Lachnospiraceae bacterium 54-53]
MSSVNAANSYSSLINSLTSSSTSTSSNDLTTEGFFKLLAAQLQNQDMSNPMDNSEMMTQMTQIAMMQAMNNFSTAMEDFSQINTINYGTSMMGKEVLLATTDSNGNLKKITGTVTRVDIYSGIPTLYINDDEKTGYPISSVMSVYEEGHTPPEDLGEETDTNKTETDTETKTDTNTETDAGDE